MELSPELLPVLGCWWRLSRCRCSSCGTLPELLPLLQFLQCLNSRLPLTLCASPVFASAFCCMVLTDSIVYLCACESADTPGRVSSFLRGLVFFRGREISVFWRIFRQGCGRLPARSSGQLRQEMERARAISARFPWFWLPVLLPLVVVLLLPSLPLLFL